MYSEITVGSLSSPHGDDPLRAAALDYVHNLLIGSQLRRLDKQQMAELEDIDIIRDLAAEMLEGTRSPRRRLTTARVRAGLKKLIQTAGPRLREPRPPASFSAQNLKWLCDTLGLDETESAILQMVFVVQSSSVEQVLDVLGSMPEPTFVRIVATLVARPQALVERALAHDGRLTQTGLLLVNHDLHMFIPMIRLRSGMRELIRADGLDRKKLVDRFLPVVPNTDLTWADFYYLDHHIALARDILKRALGIGARGINILFYGATGAGKTALASVIAQILGATLFNIAKPSNADDAAAASGRLALLVLGEKMLRNGKSLLLFDELEDLFTWSGGLSGAACRGVPSMSKQWFNQFLETNRVPTIWISNSVEGVDPAFLRRFTYVIEFRALGVQQRARILLRHVGDEFSMTQHEAQAIATRFPVSPAQAASAVRATRLVTPTGKVDRTVLERILAPTEKLVGERAQMDIAEFNAAEYDISAVNASADLGRIADQLASWKPMGQAGLTLCLYGPPGTGKSAFVRYLAQRMGRPVLYRSASDIIRPFVGETEQRIAAAFREAEDRAAVLLFDEVDSFLRDRKLARQSWEITETNEFLQQLERQRGVVVCTTNLWTDIDQAALRRFIIKVQFHYLKRDQCVGLFAKLFTDVLSQPFSAVDALEVGDTLGMLSNVASGDLAAVARRVAALGGGAHSVQELLALLVEEVRTKSGPSRRPGFVLHEALG